MGKGEYKQRHIKVGISAEVCKGKKLKLKGVGANTRPPAKRKINRGLITAYKPQKYILKYHSRVIKLPIGLFSTKWYPPPPPGNIGLFSTDLN
jgi:hypothetical protein